MLKLDDRAVKILSILARESRISKAEIAKRVNLSAGLGTDEALGDILGFAPPLCLTRAEAEVLG